jgi:hypothetical protein
VVTTRRSRPRRHRHRSSFVLLIIINREKERASHGECTIDKLGGRLCSSSLNWGSCVRNHTKK